MGGVRYRGVGSCIPLSMDASEREAGLKRKWESEWVSDNKVLSEERSFGHE